MACRDKRACRKQEKWGEFPRNGRIREQDERRAWTKCGEFNTIRAYEIDTLAISFKPRLLIVDPDCKQEGVFRCLDDAICALRPNHGGYVIKLKEGCVHELGVDVPQTVDFLKIIGDVSPVKGVPFLQDQHFDPEGIEIAPRYDYKIGKGPYNLTINGTTITINGSCNPKLDSICQGSRVGFVSTDALTGLNSLSQYKVESACGNKIVLDSSFGLNRPLLSGEGIFVYPRTTLKTVCSRKIFPTQRLEFAGLLFDTVPSFVCGTYGGYTSLENCVLQGYYFHQGTMNSSIPNIITGTFIWSFSGTGAMMYQGIVGPGSNVIFNGNPGAGMINCIFSHNTNGLQAVNSAKVHADSSDFYRNVTGAFLNSGSSVHIPGTNFRNNQIGVNMFYNSVVSSENGIGIDEEGAIPHMDNNTLTIGAEWGSFASLSNLSLRKRECDPYIRLDGRTRISKLDNPPDALGNAGSFVADSPNRFAGIM